MAGQTNRIFLTVHVRNTSFVNQYSTIYFETTAEALEHLKNTDELLLTGLGDSRGSMLTHFQQQFNKSRSYRRFGTPHECDRQTDGHRTDLP